MSYNARKKVSLNEAKELIINFYSRISDIDINDIVFLGTSYEIIETGFYQGEEVKRVSYLTGHQFERLLTNALLFRGYPVNHIDITVHDNEPSFTVYYSLVEDFKRTRKHK